MANTTLSDAKKAKNDEFYTQYADIQQEISAYLEFNPDVFRGKTVLLPCDDPEWSNFTLFFAQNFQNLGLKRLVSTSFAAESKKYKLPYQPTLFETDSPQYDGQKSKIRGKIFTLDHDITGDGKINHEDLKWRYMAENGDFRSPEVLKLRAKADIIVTNPPFSLFREFLAWIVEAQKKFLIIGNMNAITYKEVFPLIKKNQIWLGVSSGAKTYLRIDKTLQKMGNTCWFTNLDHGHRHRPLPLMTMEENLKHSKHRPIREQGYPKYENYDAIEVPYVDAIPCDYGGAMGVPVSFLDKYCLEQFEIMGKSSTLATHIPENLPKNLRGGIRFYLKDRNGNHQRLYERIVIRQRKKGAKK